MSSKPKWNNINLNKPISETRPFEAFRPCPICSSVSNRGIMQLDNFQFYTDDLRSKCFSVRNVQCLNCYAIFLNPCYSEYGFKVLFEEAGKSYGSLIEHTDEQIAWLINNNLLKKGSKVLDVGCYDGGFLSKLPDNVAKYGVDIDQNAIERGRSKYKSENINLICEDFKSFNKVDVSPDTITMYHVLEHLPDPVEVLKKIRQISHKNSRIIIEVPVLDNGNTNDIHGFFSVQHTTHFSRQSLFNCLANSGWVVEKEWRTTNYNGLRVIGAPNLDKEKNNTLANCSKDWIDVNSSLTSWRNAIANVELKIQKIPKSKRVVIWGAGAHTEYLYSLTSLFYERANSNFIIVDSDEIKQGKTWRGINIYHSDAIKQFDWKDTNLIISSYGSQEEIFEEALNMGAPKKSVHKLYETIRRY